VHRAARRQAAAAATGDRRPADLVGRGAWAGPTRYAWRARTKIAVVRGAAPGEAGAVPGPSAKRALIAVLVAAFVGGAVWAYATGRASAASVEAWLGSLGPAAPALFVGAFVGGALLGLPGMVFVVGGRLAFGAQAGFVLGYGGGVLACVVPFVLARRLRGGRAEPWRPGNRHLRRALDLVESHPLRAVVLLRLAMWFSPPLSYALAMTGVRAPAYAAGCALGLAPVVAVAVLTTGWMA
jgi:uncharacterized membrane protein YdjX (TVP38/TMEM64 family)